MPTSSTALAKDFQPETKQQALAVELAQALGDTENFACYLSLTKRYQAAYLRRVLGIALEIPEKNIKKSRGALFVYLVKNFNRP